MSQLMTPDYSRIANFSIDVLKFLSDNKIDFSTKGTNVGSGRVNITCYSCDDPSKHLSINQRTGQFICRRCGECGSFEKLANKISGQKILDLYISEEDSIPFLPTGVWTLLSTFIPMYELDEKSTPYLKYCLERKIPSSRFLHWYYGTGKYTGYLIIPVKRGDEIVSFVGRRVLGKGPKYNNCPESISGIALSTLTYSTLFEENKPLVVVEGIFDAERLGNNAIALLGKIAVTPEKIAYIRSLNPTSIVIALDSDTTELERMKIADLFSACGKPTKILNFTGKKDLGEMTDDEIAGIRSLIFTP